MFSLFLCSLLLLLLSLSLSTLLEASSSSFDYSLRILRAGKTNSTNDKLNNNINNKNSKNRKSITKKTKTKTKNNNMKNKDSDQSSSIADTMFEQAKSLTLLGRRLVRGTVKKAVDLVSTKHVTSNQILGKWRLMSEVQTSEGVLTYPVAVELCEGNKLKSFCEGEEIESTFEFIERQWPQKCSISFQIRSLQQQPVNSAPTSLLYKGSFKVSIMNPKIILMRGSLYKITGKSFWKNKKKCGKFKGTKRRYA